MSRGRRKKLLEVLEYHETQGRVEKKVIEQAVRYNQPLPDKIKDAPFLHMGLNFYFRAYLELNTCRANGIGAGPIPWTALKDYAEFYGVTGCDAEDFFYFIQSIDDYFLEKKKKSKTKSNPTPRKG